MNPRASRARPAARPPRPAPRAHEPWWEQLSSLIGFFVYLLIFKSFFLPLFIIPTGSMADTLYGAHAVHTCPNCGTEYAVGWPERPDPGYQPLLVQCPNCRWREGGGRYDARVPRPDQILTEPLQSSAGDRIFVHGWYYDGPVCGLDDLKPQRWDVVVFKVPTDGEQNYIKRLIGLPNEKIELINGDVFVNDQLSTKSADAQRSLWMPYYDHDRLPQKAALSARYHPRWEPVETSGGWSGLRTRVFGFEGAADARAEIQFVTEPGSSTAPGKIEDDYAYDPPGASGANVVGDVRLSAEIALARTEPNGYVELSLARNGHHFYARLGGDGSLRLEHQLDTGGGRETWDQGALTSARSPVLLALSHVDGTVVVEVDGRRVLASSPSVYAITPELARAQAAAPTTPTLRLAAAGVTATVRHVRIDRDVYYTSDTRIREYPGYGTTGRPITLGPNEYFLLGDNSPASQDARYAFARPGANPVGPHLREAEHAGRFHPGTVPGDQLIGRAFFVYFPGLQPPKVNVPGWGSINVRPDLGRVRWIR